MNADIIRQRDNGLIDARQTTFDTDIAETVRPKTLADYMGQSQLKQTINISIAAAKQRHEPLDHVLLYGPAGLGKTTMALVLAQEMEAECIITSAPALERPRDIVGLLMTIQPNSLVFIDEIHRLNKVTEEILYSAMEDFVLDRTLGKGPTTKTLRVPLPKFTLVGATTKAGSMANPLRDRFGLTFRLAFYTPEELVQILRRSAGIMNIQLPDDSAHAIAVRSRGTPRIANRLLRRVRDYVQVKHGLNAPLPINQVNDALNLFEIDTLGLDTTDRRMLNTMAESFNGGPVGLETLATAMGEDSRTLEDVVEPYLMQIGLVQRTPRGRQLSPKAIEMLGLKNLSSQQTLL